MLGGRAMRKGDGTGGHTATAVSITVF